MWLSSWAWRWCVCVCVHVVGQVHLLGDSERGLLLELPLNKLRCVRGLPA
jgi:hypothetical protein